MRRSYAIVTNNWKIIMTQNTVKKLLGKDLAAAHYALIDCAVTAAVTDGDDIFLRLSDPGIRKFSLFTGENTIVAEQTAPYLVPLDDQPDIQDWLMDNGWGRSWSIFFTSEADNKTLLAHLRRFFQVRAENGRDLFFRFFDPVILRDFLPMLTADESACFFGPVTRYVLEDENGRPLSFDRPAGPPAADMDPSRLITAKRHLFAAAWNLRLLQAHKKAYEAMGVDVAIDPEQNALTIKEKDGTQAALQKTPAGVAVTTGEGRLFQYELSTCKNPTAIIDPAGNRIDYDLQERENVVSTHRQSLLSAIRMENNRKTWVFDYDEDNHLARIDYPDGTSALPVHDAYGNLCAHTDRNGHVTRMERDAHERLTRMIDTNGQATTFDYEDRKAPSRIRFADGAAFEFAYTEQGSLQAFLANNEKVADYTVDRENGSWSARYTDGTWAHFTVQNDKVVRAQNPAGTLVLDYDENGRLCSETFNNQTVAYQRNESGLLTGIIAPSGQTIVFERDGEQRISQITDWNDRTIGIGYSLNGALERIDYPNGLKLLQHTAPSGLPERMTLTSPLAEDPIFDRRFERDLLERVTQLHDGQHTIHYAYDNEGRLLGVHSDQADRCESFSIDAKANRLSDGITDYTINAADRIAQPGFDHDALGNLTQSIGPGGSAAYDWQSANRLTRATLKDTRAHYAYDAFGRRVEKQVNGTRTRYTWAGAQLLCEIILSADGDRTIDYLFFPGTPALLALRDNQQSYYAAFGHRYETLCLTDLSGATAWQADYDAFGNARIMIGADLHQPMRLAGHYLDAETGLHYSSARYYDPHLGRYLSLDPLFLEGGGDNFYAYCNGDPINGIDPTGEFIFCAILIGAAIGAAIGGGIEYYRQKQTGKAVDGFKVAKAALIGGAIGVIGGGVGAVVEAGVAAGTAGTILGKSALGTMAATGFLSGAAGSVAEQCTGAAMVDNALPPLEIATQAATDGVIGAVIGLTGFGVLGVLAPRVRKGYRAAKGTLTERKVQLARKATDNRAKTTITRAGDKSVQVTDATAISAAGDPVNSVTGEVILTQTDFTLPGRIPLSWTRHYGSRVSYSGYLGTGWQTPADARLELEDDMVLFYDGSPGGAVFESLPTDTPIMEVANGAMLSADPAGYQVKLKSGVSFHFGRDFEKQISSVTRISDINGNNLTFIRRDGILSAINDSSGRTIEIVCENGRIVQMTCNKQLLVSYQYQDGALTAVIDAFGHGKRYAYQDGRMIRHSSRNHLSFHYQYDHKGRCIHGFGDHGLYDYHFEYLPYDRCTRVTDSLDHLWHYHYNTGRLPTKVVDPTGAATIYSYDDVGRVIAVTDPLERTTRYDYDAAGNVIEITQPDDSRMVFVYDDNHRPIQIMDPNDHISEYRFDDHGRLIEKISPLGHGTRYTYHRTGELAAISDPQDRTTSFEWDDSGLIATVISPSGNRTHYQHDLFGNITAIIDPTGQTTRYSYDEKSRLNAAVSLTGRRQSFEWDPEDNLLRYTAADGTQTRFEYTGINEMARRINADGTSVSYSYDTEERLTCVTNEKGQTHRFTYDPASRVTTQTDYHGQSHHYHYDPAGQLIQSIDPLQQSIAFTYDPAGRMVTKLFENEERETFSWDPAGHLIAFESPDIRVERTFDPDGRMIAEQSGGFEVKYDYDASGLRTGRTTNHGNRIVYDYDADGIVSAIGINDHMPLRFYRNPLGQITTEQLSDQLVRTYGYDEEGRLIHQRISSNIHQIDRSFQYDLSGHLIGKHDSSKGNWRFSYDPMGRIIESIDPLEQVKQYNYDPAGNLLSHCPKPNPTCAPPPTRGSPTVSMPPATSSSATQTKMIHPTSALPGTSKTDCAPSAPPTIKPSVWPTTPWAGAAPARHWRSAPPVYPHDQFSRRMARPSVAGPLCLLRSR